MCLGRTPAASAGRRWSAQTPCTITAEYICGDLEAKHVVSIIIQDKNMYYTVTNCTYIFYAYRGVQCANKTFKYLAPEATLESC